MHKFAFVAVFLGLAAILGSTQAWAQPAPFECPWTEETDDVPSSGGDYGGA